MALIPILGWPAAILVIVLMGLSRLILGVHYPSDVIAGIGIGLPIGIAFSILL